MGRVINKHKQSSYKAFTLAEVLITLMIIGIVGALTIPGFIAEHQKTVYVTSFKKFYSSFNNNMNTYLAKNGCTGDIMCSGILGTTDMTKVEQAAEFEKIVPELFPGAQKCNPRTLCMPYRYKVTSNNGNMGWESYPMIYRLTDGMIFLPFITSNTNSAGIYQTCSSTLLCGMIAIDVNGKKKPNIVGRDVFTLSLNSKGNLAPVPHYIAASGVTNSCNPNRTDYYQLEGQGCGTKVLRANWEMNY